MAAKNSEKTTKGTKIEKSGADTSPLSLSSFKDIDRMFDDYFNRSWLRPLRSRSDRMEDLWGTYEMRSPSMDMIDKDNEIILHVELPGVDKKDLDVTVADNILTVKGTSNFESKEDKDDYYHSEIKKGSFSRSLSLPSNVDSTKIKANLKDGMLELSIPKTNKTTRKSIKVS